MTTTMTQTPQSVRALGNYKTPTVYNWSIGVQRSMPWRFVGDVAYVGNAARNQLVSRELNGLPYGATFQSQYLDPTNNNQPLPNDLIRPYRGYGSITQREFTGYGDYHALQVSAQRLPSSRISFGVAYTGSISRNLGAIDPFVEDNVLRNYTLNGSRPHNVAINYSYRIPGPSTDNVLARAATAAGAEIVTSSRVLGAPEMVWLNEGWAMYAQYLWEQEQYEFGDDELSAYLRKSDADLRKRLGPPGHPKAANFAESNVYICPAAMLQRLNDALGDKKFFALATAWVQTQKNTQQTRASFIAFVNKQTGRDFTGLIDEWLDSPTTPAA